jgi:hypothetical protein
MPDDGNLVDLDQKTRDWIARFNNAKGWKTLVVPSPKAPGGGKLKATSEGHFRDRLKAVGDKDEIDKNLAADRKELNELRVNLLDEKDEAKKAEIQEEIDALLQKISDGEASLELIALLTERLDRIKEVEADLPADVQKVEDEIERLRGYLDAPTDTIKKNAKTPTEDELARFRDFHSLVEGNVDKARNEVMTLTRETDTGTLSRNVAVINKSEYKILTGLLEQSIMLMQLGRMDLALARVQQAADLLVEYRTARTGADPIEEADTLHPKLDGPIMDTESMISVLRTGKHTAAADILQKALDELKNKVKGAINAKVGKIEETFLKPCQELAEAAKADVRILNQIKELLAEARQMAAVMRANGHEVRPDRIERGIALYAPEADMTANLKTARELNDYAKARLDKSLDQDLDEAKVNPEELKKKLADLQQRYDALFKQDKQGNMKMIKDTQTGLLKGDKKNSDLPRETLREIELRILAAEQFLQSQSVDALKEANKALSGTEVFMNNIDKYPDMYDTFRLWYVDLDKKLGKLASKFPLYEVGKRADLKIVLDKLKEDYMTQPQATVLQRTKTLEADIETYSTLVTRLQSEKRALDKLADGIEKQCDGIGKLLKDNKITCGGKPFDKYEGSLRTDLEEIRADITMRTEESLKRARGGLVDLQDKVDEAERVVEKFGTDRKGMRPNDKSAAESFIRDAGKARDNREANEARKKDFENGVSALEKKLKELGKLLKEVRAETSEFDAIESELSTLKKTAKADHMYIEALDKLALLERREVRLTGQTQNAKRIVDATLPDAARMVTTMIREFRTAVGGFYDTVLYPAANDKATKKNAFDAGTFDAAKIKAFLNSIVVAIPDSALTDLEKATASTVDTGLSKPAQKDARKTALKALRQLMAVMDGFKPVMHFRTNPFSASAANKFGAARQALPRLELRLLTAIKD